MKDLPNLVLNKKPVIASAIFLSASSWISSSKASLGMNSGESFETELVGKKVQLTVNKIVRRTPAEVTDELVAGMGVEGVSTIDEYR